MTWVYTLVKALMPAREVWKVFQAERLASGELNVSSNIQKMPHMALDP
jgi:hypothetical protein